MPPDAYPVWFRLSPWLCTQTPETTELVFWLNGAMQGTAGTIPTTALTYPLNAQRIPPTALRAAISSVSLTSLYQQQWLQPDLNLAWVLLGLGLPSVEATQTEYAEWQSRQQAAITTALKAAEEDGPLSHGDREGIRSSFYEPEARLQEELVRGVEELTNDY